MSKEKPVVPAANSPTVEETLVFAPRLSVDGLIPAIVTAEHTGEVLMFAHMNREALAKTLETGVAHFWSRSRAKLWRKGEESGNVLKVAEIRTDCDQDVLWLKVTVLGDGVACHTGARSCFYRRLVTSGSAGGIILERTLLP